MSYAVKLERTIKKIEAEINRKIRGTQDPKKLDALTIGCLKCEEVLDGHKHAFVTLANRADRRARK